MVYNQKVKAYIDGWRQQNKEKWDLYHNEKQKEYNTRNRETILAKKKEIYEYKKFINNTNHKYEWNMLCQCLLE
jgi:hypothetical protein